MGGDPVLEYLSWLCRYRPSVKIRVDGYELTPCQAWHEVANNTPLAPLIRRIVMSMVERR